MQSRTSFFNKTHFFKSMSRFWPIWAFYLAVWLFVLPVSILSNRVYNNAYTIAAGIINMAIYVGPVGAASVSIVSVMAVWSFLYNTRTCHGTVCLPMRRENLFLSTMAAGIVPLLLANVLIAGLSILASLVVGAFHSSLPYASQYLLNAVACWFGMTTLELLFFYGFATFCAMLTGNIVVLPLVYGVLNFVAVGVSAIVRALMSIFLFGFEGISMTGVVGTYGSPVVAIYTKVRDIGYEYHDVVRDRWYSTSIGIHGWGVLAIYAVVGVLLCVAALLLFRARKMETAGDTVAIRILKPVFRWCMALGAGLCFGCLMFAMFYSFNPGGAEVSLFLVVCMIIGSFVGWFVGEMIIKKSFRVFSRGLNGFGGWGICAAVILLSAVTMHFDLLGLESYTPRAEQVQSVTISGAGDSVELRQPENIAAAIAVHQGIVAQREHYENAFVVWTDGMGFGSYNDTIWVTLKYDLGARSVERQYRLCYNRFDESTQTDVLALQTLVNTPEAIASRKTGEFPVTAENITGGYVEMRLPATECAQLAGYYDDVELYILREHCGYGIEDRAAMSEQERQAAISEAIVYQSVGGKFQFTESALHPAVPEMVVDEEVYDRYAGPMLDLDNIDYSQVYFDYNVSFSREELWELYSQCIVPDMADGTIGRIYLVRNGDYANSVYDARIHIDCREKRQGTYDGYAYNFFYTIPTVDSYRTNTWLADHGLHMYLEGQINEN